MTAAGDVVYSNKGVQDSESRADKLTTEINKHDKHAANELLADAHKGTPTEQQAFWHKMQIHNGNKSADTHLPDGFEVVGKDGKHVVKDSKGHIVYDEAKTAAKAAHDAKIHAGEGPYAAFRRQGMTDAEAKTAAEDVKATTQKGNDGFKQGESYTRDEDGKGNWHKQEREDAARRIAAEKQRKADEDIAKNKELDGQKAAVEVGTKKAGDAVDKFGGHFWHTSKYLTKDDIAGALPGATGDDKAGLNYIKDHFEAMAKKSSSGDYVDADGIAAYKKAQEAQIASERPKATAS